jgi:hypothetical protein
MLVPALKTEELLEWLKNMEGVATTLAFKTSQVYSIKDFHDCYVDLATKTAYMPGWEQVILNDRRYHPGFPSNYVFDLQHMRSSDADIRLYLSLESHPERIFLDLGHWSLDTYLLGRIDQHYKDLQRIRRLQNSEGDYTSELRWIEAFFENLAERPAGMKRAYDWYNNQTNCDLPFVARLKDLEYRKAPLSIKQLEGKFRQHQPTTNPKNMQKIR